MVVILALAVLLAACSPDAGSDDGHGQMPLTRGDAARTGVQPGPAPSGRPDVKWRYRAGFGLSDPVLVDGAVVFGDRTGVRSVGTALAKERWWFPTDSPASTPAFADGMVIAGTTGGSVLAIDAKTGEARWRAETGKSIKASPLALDTTLFVGGGEASSQGGSVYAFDLASGAAKWEFAVPMLNGANDVVAAPLSAGDGLIYAGTLGGRLYAIDAATGVVDWTFAAPEAASIVAPAAFADGVVFVSVLVADDANDILYALNASSGDELWQFSPGGGNSAPAVVDDMVIAGADDGYLYGIDVETGELRWYSSTGSFATSAPVIVDEQVYAVDVLGNLSAFDRISGTLRWQTEIGKAPFASPAIAGNGIYVRTNEGLVAVV